MRILQLSCFTLVVLFAARSFAVDLTADITDLQIRAGTSIDVTLQIDLRVSGSPQTSATLRVFQAVDQGQEQRICCDDQALQVYTGAGNRIQVPATVPSSARTVRFRALADPLLRVFETNEQNNSDSVDSQVAPDIAFVGVTPLIQPQINQFKISMSVINIGFLSARASRGRVLVDGQLKSSFDVPSLKGLGTRPANQTGLELTVSPVGAGPHSVRIDLDVDNQISESDEANNSAIRSVSITSQ
ncbi:hypothetical protein L0222_21100 [bacterium]|nr:hypothetical protein [bacterium]MCI0606970.1 hypothetical protein [bacterium]